MRKNIVVIGGSGFIGTNLLLKLSKYKEYNLVASYFKKKIFLKYLE